MLAPILALSLLPGTAAVTPYQPQPVQVSDASTVVLDCRIDMMMLAGCMVVGDVGADRTAAALKMAAVLKVPDPVLESGVDHVRIRVKLSATEASPASQTGTNGH